MFDLAITDGLAVLTVEVDLHDANITKLNENDAAQNEKISALEATVTGEVTCLFVSLKWRFYSCYRPQMSLEKVMFIGVCLSIGTRGR